MDIAIPVVAGFLLTSNEVEQIAKRVNIPLRRNVHLDINSALRNAGYSPRLIPVCYPRESDHHPAKLWFIVVSERQYQTPKRLTTLDQGTDSKRVQTWLKNNGIGQLRFQTIWDPYGKWSVPEDAPKQYESCNDE